MPEHFSPRCSKHTCSKEARKQDVFQTCVPDVPEVPEDFLMFPKRRKRLTLYHHVVQEMLTLYSEGMPRHVISEEYHVAQATLRRLISEYETLHGPDSLRSTKVIRHKK